MVFVFIPMELVGGTVQGRAPILLLLLSLVFFGLMPPALEINLSMCLVLRNRYTKPR